MTKKKSTRRDNAVANHTATAYSWSVNFAEIKRRRRSLGMTQREAAKAAGWATTQVWTNMENGQRQNPQVLTLARIADVLGCKVDDLLTKKRDVRKRAK